MSEVGTQSERSPETFWLTVVDHFSDTYTYTGCNPWTRPNYMDNQSQNLYSNEFN